MAPRATIHRIDATEALQASLGERAAGHLLAADPLERFNPPTDPLGVAVTQSVLRASLAARDDRRYADAIRLLAVHYLLTREPTGLNRLLHDLIGQEDVEGLLFLSHELASRAQPGTYLYVMALLHRTLAEHAQAGLNFQQARLKATAQTVVYMDIALQADPGNTALRSTRIDKNGDLANYAAVIADLRRLGPDPAEDNFLNRTICFNLRHILHPEARAALDGILQDPPTDLPGVFALYSLVVAMGAMDDALRVAEWMTRWSPEYAMLPALRRMADETERLPDLEFGAEPTGRKLIYFSLVCWGQKYVDLLGATSLPSLLSPRNLPTLASDNDLVIEIVTNASDADAIADLAALRRLSEIARVRIFTFPTECEPHQNALPYVTFGYGAHSTIRRAQNHGADLIFLLPDVIFSDGCFETVAGLVTDEKRVIMTDGLNARATPVLRAIAPFRSTDGTVLTIDPAALCAIAARWLMKRTRENYFDPDADVSPKLPARLCFQEPDGVSVHSFHKMPLYVSHAAFKEIRNFHYTTPDGAFAESVLSNVTQEQAIQFERIDQAVLLEINDQDGAVSPPTERNVIDVIAEYFRDFYYSERLYWNFERGMRYPLTPEAEARVVTASEKADCLAQVRKLFATHPIFVDWAGERDKVRRLEFGDGATPWRLTSTEGTKRC